MDLNGLSFLLIDDDDGDRKLVRRLLGKRGFTGVVEEVFRVEDLADAKERHFDVVFLDYYLPRANGLELLPELRRVWPQASIILTTGQGSEDVAKTAILQGATDYIAKDTITEDSLFNTIFASVETAQTRWRVERQRTDLATFSEVLVHDFKAPIRAAAFLAEQIDEDLTAGEMGEAQQALRLLKKSAEQMHAMIHSLSDHIRLDRDMELLPNAPERLIDAALTALSLEISERGVRMSIDVDDDVPEILCSGPQISQMLQNLVSNAIKFSTAPHPDIRISVNHGSDGVLFKVADDGVGIAPEHLDTIFQPFKRAPGADGVVGTGLGLATCRKIALRHEGRIWCRSTLGRGTTVCVLLPAPANSQSHQVQPQLLSGFAEG